MKFSIIIPAYNVENYIVRTLNSLKNQEEGLFEIIIVDDGSTDNTLTRIQETITNNKNNSCKVIKKVNEGVSIARNTGLHAASGEYIIFLDGDDFFEENLLGNLDKYIKDDERYDVLSWGYDIVTEDNTKIRSYFDNYSLPTMTMTGTETLLKIFENMLWLGTQNTAFNRDFLLNIGINYTEGCTNGEDQEFIYKALAKAENVLYVKQILSYYLQREGSISNSYNIKKFDALFATKRTYEFISGIGNQDLDSVIEKLKNEHFINSYLNNFITCLSYMAKKSPLNDCIPKLKSEIEHFYPGINKEVTDVMNNYKGKNKKLLIRTKTFLISPNLYYWLMNCSNKLKAIRRG